jgi:hypothetical protein
MPVTSTGTAATVVLKNIMKTPARNMMLLGTRKIFIKVGSLVQIQITEVTIIKYSKKRIRSNQRITIYAAKQHETDILLTFMGQPIRAEIPTRST